MKLGIISDTHSFLDPKIPKLFAGVKHILHAGDVGPQSLLLELEVIAPVTAVLGNTDLFLNLKLAEIVELGGRKFLIHHIVNPRGLTGDLKELIERAKPHVVVFGHTHKPFCETMRGVLFFNPGYAGKQRFALKRSVAILHCDAKGMRPEFITL